ncbi:NAD-dependent epimerase/dehydratase family protein [Bosea sp. BH3]|uniref:NAD-dependent epimerase/dehydratase family protein n=1 Tax=Bosea sp. BH3 TaxID=2871701 RepID=UPI0021CB8E57|nr:NAD(P)-dependent oxidoreductase [Bosea sp. BH3]MCU4181259.1 NAD(P)-dependent oxidoreductase [Bosea sp. BH3]
MDRVLITGASGFIGRHLARHCRTFADETWALTRPGRGSALPAELRAAEADLEDEASLRSAIHAVAPSLIMHLAAYGVAPQDRDPLAMQRVNVDLGAAIVRAAAGCGAAVVSAGSCAEYAQPDEPKRLSEQAPLEHEKLYGSSKAAGGLLALGTAAALGVPMRHLRLFNVYGPGEAPHRLIPSLVAQRGSGRRVSLSAGSQIRDFIHVDDATAGIAIAGRRLQAGTIRGSKALNLCTGVGTTVRDLATLAAEACGVALDNLGFGDLPMRADEIPYLVGDPDEMAFDLDWRATYGPAAGVKATVET